MTVVEVVSNVVFGAVLAVATWKLFYVAVHRPAIKWRDQALATSQKQFDEMVEICASWKSKALEKDRQLDRLAEVAEGLAEVAELEKTRARCASAQLWDPTPN